MSDADGRATRLSTAVVVGREAAQVGFDWERPGDALDKVAEEIGELREAMARGRAGDVAEEVGDLLFAVCNVARMLDIDPDEALQHATEKFEDRFSKVLAAVAADGATPLELSLAELEAYWEQVKAAAP